VDRHRAQLTCAMLGAVMGVVVAMVTAAFSEPEAAAAATAAAPAALTATRADTGSGCGLRAVTAGAFNPACSDYQGYLDPGTTAGRAPTSGERQQQQLCETGRAPKSQCR
jgi:hypothetical protein